MARKGKENLIPLNRRTKEEQKRITSEGGKASGKARRAKKTMREYAELLMELPVADTRKRNKLAKSGVTPEDCDNKMLLVYAMMQRAQEGDVAAFRELRGLIGEAGDDRKLERLDELLEEFKNATE